MLNKKLSSKLSLTTKAISFALLASYGSLSHGEVLNSQTPITPQNIVKIMGAGVDSTWSEVPSKIADYTSTSTEAFAEKGFKHIRLRVAKDSPTEIFKFLDEQIQDALDNGMIPIIANQSHTFEDNPTVANQEAWNKWWTDVAEHYKDYPYELMFDLIVEIAASSALSNEPINQLNTSYEDVVTSIRNTGGNNDKRIIIFSAHKRSDATRMSQLDIPSQGNGYLIGEFHEGYASGPSKDPTNPHYYWEGTPEEIKLMTDRADAAVAWSASTGIPIWEGAWMPGNYNKGDDYDVNRQIAFVNDFVKVLNDRNIPHAVNATKKFYDVSTNTWNSLETVVDAIIALDVSTPVAKTLIDDGFESGDLSNWAVTGYQAKAVSSAAFTGNYGVLLKQTTRMKSTISTVDASSATLTFDYKTNNFDTDDSLKVEYSIDGGSNFINMSELTSTQWVNQTITLPNEALGVANLVIKFANVADKNQEKSYVDNIKLITE